jgi:hypothetical protein
MAKTEDRLELLEKKHDIKIFIHIRFCGESCSRKVYRIIEDESERHKSISKEALNDLNIFLVREYGSLSEKIKTFFAKKKFEKFPLKELGLSITIEEIERLQELESKGYKLANSCYD